MIEPVDPQTVMDHEYRFVQFLGEGRVAHAEFVKGHPTFADEFGVHKTRNGAVAVRGLEDATAGDAQINSEWAFDVASGYKECIIDVVSAIHGWTDVPFDKA